MCNPNIEWKQLEDFPNYWISNLGQVWSERKKEILPLRFNKGRTYVSLSLWKGDSIKTKSFRIYNAISYIFLAKQNIPKIGNFKQIKGFPDYLINEKGEIWSIKKGGLLIPSNTPAGYPQISLRCNNKTYKFMVHRLVLETFIGPAPKGKECHHKDANRANCQLSNLEWVTSSENNLYIFKLGRGERTKEASRKRNYEKRGEKHPLSKLNKYEVQEIRKRILQGVSYKNIAKEFNVSPGNICAIKTGKTWSWLTSPPEK